MTGWADNAKEPVDGFNRGAAPTRNPWDGKPVTDFNDLFVMVHRPAIRLATQRFHSLCKAKRLVDNTDKDICKRVSVLEEVFGYRRNTLQQLLSPGSAYTARYKADESAEEPLLSDYIRLRTTARVKGDSARYEDLEVDETRAHVWHSQNDDEPRWRLDVTPINIVDGKNAKGRAKRVLATPADAFVGIPFWWMYEDPATTGGDTWVEKRYYVLVPETTKDPKTGKKVRTGRMVEKDVTAKAIRAAAVVAACATHEFKRGQKYGIAGLATVAGISTTEMAQDLGYAEDAGLIGVANRKGRNKALRWVRMHPNDPRSPEGRVRRSYGPTKAHNADAMVERQAARESRAAAEALLAAEEAEFEEATTEWLRGLPTDATTPEMAFVLSDEPPF